MGLDILLFRDEKGLELVTASQKARYDDVAEVQAIVELDAALRAAANDVVVANTEINTKSRSVGAIVKDMKSGKITKEEGDQKMAAARAEVLELKAKLPALKAREAELEAKRESMLNVIGNIVHASVPIHDDEEFNRQEKTWGERRMEDNLLRYDQILQMIGGVDMTRGSKVSGNRCYFLTGIGVRLNLALVQYGLDFLTREELGDGKYTEISTPFFMNQEAMAKTAQLEQFDEELYAVLEMSRGSASGDDAPKLKDKKYLIATSEQPLSAYHMDEWIQEQDLPIRYAGQSTCFRKEAGSAKDVRGIFRVHQFDKIEQFCITTPEKSWEEHERMLLQSELFYQSLDLPYQVIAIVSGALNKAASKKLDLEAWFPAQKAYRELVSCSNCTDYQSRSLGIRCGAKTAEQKQKRYVHMLNSTLVATTRTICCLLEVHQTPEGVNVPKVLQPYLRGLTFIPFIHPVPVDEMEKSKAGKAGTSKKPAAAASV